MANYLNFMPNYMRGKIVLDPDQGRECALFSFSMWVGFRIPSFAGMTSKKGRWELNFSGLM